jgi:hypothetical protein
MKTKIYVGDRYHGKFTCDGRTYSKWQVFKFRMIRRAKRVTLVLGAFCLLGWAYYFGSAFAPAKVQAVDKPVYIVATTTAPVMERIAKCESGGSQYDKNGQVVIQVNNDKTVDIGKYQINSIHNPEAHRMNLDLTNPKDNETYARYIYENRGTSDWYSSRDCWSK